ncbi:hypothetical protein PV325_010120 [Microctonus aethiopoides]|uniref:Uncharacterized protein n=1 Tax=Microctonus aethiopoides TaxID=144406 RepID=A0AA39KR99_9HYME|nr:hypothetical protein PV325_010120 [Microctonus aethiopoides]KAK0093588.1 hypothetical protein PV326_013184 [Microctonus aethiopoides]KAK0170802.1 hypothetical protein PV328_008600 [Microctonus aethiopoides]
MGQVREESKSTWNLIAKTEESKRVEAMRMSPVSGQSITHQHPPPQALQFYPTAFSRAKLNPDSQTPLSSTPSSFAIRRELKLSLKHFRPTTLKLKLKREF